MRLFRLVIGTMLRLLLLCIYDLMRVSLLMHLLERRIQRSEWMEHRLLVLHLLMLGSMH